MLHIVFYTKENCSICVDAEALLSIFRHEYPYELEVRDIYTKDEWLEEYQLSIPVVEINGKQLNCEEINYDSLKQFLIEESRKEIG
ncbi:glutaredoxin family protein [Oceanobacillus bengalensis]|uniref:Glutaredoxin family protein n=1 Tax=Oceanobacillus bengalensis TaxID=1435466 RepID=A0A494Z6R9_9BACI|nr:glutaredoxin family protein [Oceanobacillus bengalensis]RKQ18259.1 glutaredoxin family protein [Oceanobacillus bengalensis]